MPRPMTRGSRASAVTWPTLAAEHDHSWFEHQVPGWAQRCASADGSGDDTTIALLLAPAPSGAT